jgi:hypothetical protein
MVADFKLPGASDRTVIVGQNGSGKTILGGWLLSRQNMDARPWVALDYKREELWDMVGDPPMRPLGLNQMPGKRGLYRLPVHPNDDEALEEWLWKIWERGDVGLFADEASLLPRRGAFKAILRQGRSLRIPVIACTQRPVDCDREIFTEAKYRALFGVEDSRDWQTVSGLFGDGKTDVRKTLPEHWSYWYDTRQRHVFTLKPCPNPASVAADLKRAAPYSWFWGS